MEITGVYLQMNTHTHTHTHVHYIYTMKYYLAFKKKEIVSFVTTWLKLKVTILSEINQIGKVNIVEYHLYVKKINLSWTQKQRIEQWLLVAWGWEK